MNLELLKNPYWRLNNLYYIKDKQGKRMRFRLNWAQKDLYDSMWFLNIILKARQLGLTTFIQIFMLDRCLFNSDTSAGVVAQTAGDAKAFFNDKIKYAYDNLPEEIRAIRPADKDSAAQLTFSNGSSIRVGVSLRSSTIQYLHISEFGKICAQYPERAEEIVSGALETVAKGRFVFIESTAEGDYGRFYDMCMQFMQHSGKLTSLDYKFIFYPWYKHPDYELDLEGEKLDTPVELDSYFAKLEHDKDIKLTEEQKHWYIKKKAVQKGKMTREYPSTPQEAFETISEYAIYGEELGKVLEENRYTDLPIPSDKPVDMFFDIGKSVKAESTAVWFMQHNDPWYDFVDYYQNKLQTVATYVADIRAKGHRIGKWYIPHDADSQKDYEMKSFKDRLTGAGVPVDDIIVVPVVSSVKVGIDMMKGAFPKCRFNKARVQDGWRALRAYSWSWDEKRAIVGDPIHNWASHPSDAIRQFAQGFKPYDDTSDWWSEDIKYKRSDLI